MNIRIPPHILYPGLVIAILLMSVTANVVLVIKASSDGGARAVPDYYDKASRWDAEQAREAARRDHRSASAPTPRSSEAVVTTAAEREDRR